MLLLGVGELEVGMALDTGSTAILCEAVFSVSFITVAAEAVVECATLMRDAGIGLSGA